MRIRWAARKSKQLILKKINTEHSLEGLMLNVNLPYFGQLMQRADWLEKTLMLAKTEGNRRRRQQRMRWLDGITYSMDMLLLLLSHFRWDISLNKLPEIENDMEAWCL